MCTKGRIWHGARLHSSAHHLLRHILAHVDGKLELGFKDIGRLMETRDGQLTLQGGP